ncbi:MULTISPECIES: transcription elongation factor [unclassified Mesorhizobium]|uniref:transcription elongation factor n=1 Tax=unclassified Mesorhizobium TaxID=325217 RepID=UPI0015E3C6F8|nr:MULTISPECIES: transcription elongation factor [unclassified Mesorhizobium]
MMSKLSLPHRRISAGDHMRLQALARSLAEQSHPLAAVFAGELDLAELRDPDDMRQDTVSLDRFVTYRIMGSEGSERRLLIHPEDQMWPPAEVSVATPLGITLLGLSAGDRMPVVGTGLPEPPWVEVLAIGSAASGGLARRPTFFPASPSRAPGLSLADNQR